MSERSTTIRDRHRTTIARTQPPCALCGKPIDYTLHHLDPMSYVVDHVLPLNRGGTDTLDNKQAAHRSCNRAKSDRVDGGPVLRRSGSLDRGGSPLPPRGRQPFSA